MNSKSKIQNLIEKLNDTFTTHDLVMAIIANTNKDRLPNNSTSWHWAFYRLEQSDFNKYFVDFCFNRHMLYPYSRELYDILFALELSDILPWVNNEYIINKNALIKSKEQFIKFFNHEDLNQITEIFLREIYK